MTSAILALALVVSAADAPKPDSTPRKPNPFAPSLPLLTDEEEAKLDQIVDRFIQFDTGKLKGEEGKKALQEFQKLGAEAAFALIRGLNKAAELEATCPAATLAKRLAAMLKATDDVQLLEFARENIGAGVDKSPHSGILKDLKVLCLLRKRDVTQKNLAAKNQGVRGMSVTDLAKAANAERGSKLKEILTELEGRTGKLAFDTLVMFAEDADTEIQQLSQDLLARQLARQGPNGVKEKLKDERPVVRSAAARAAGDKGMRLGTELIDLLGDKEADVQQAARQALVKLAKGPDYGPERDAKETDRTESIRQWRAWWAKQAR